MARAPAPDPRLGIEGQPDDTLLAMTLWGEARGQPLRGKAAVANVILNRAKRSGSSIRDVVLAPKQFSVFDPDDPGRPMLLDPLHHGSEREWDDSYAIAKLALEGKLSDRTGGATNYYNATTAKPAWGRGSPSWHEHTTIGAHVFGTTGDEDSSQGGPVSIAPAPAETRTKLWQFIPPEALQQTPLNTLRPGARAILDLDIPPGYPPDRAARIGEAIASRLPRMVVGYKRDQRRAFERAGFETPEEAAANAGPGVTPALRRFAPSPLGRLVRSTVAALPSTRTAPEPMVAARTPLEHAADFAGGTAGFLGTAGAAAGATELAGVALAPATLGASIPIATAAAPFVGLAAAGALPAGTAKERAIRAGVNVTLGKFGEVLSRVGTMGMRGVGAKVAAHGISAGTFAAAPAAEAAARKATGEKNVEWPKLQDLVQGGAELFGLNVLLGAIGAAGLARTATTPVERVRRGLPPRRIITPPPERLALPEAGTPETQAPAPIGRRLPPSSAPSGGTIITPPPTGPTPPYVAPVGRQLPPAVEGGRVIIPPAPLAPQHQAVSDRVAATLPPAEQPMFVELFRRALANRPDLSVNKAVQLAGSVRTIARSLTEPTPPTPELRQRAMQLTADLNQRFAGKTVRMAVGGVQTEGTIVRIAYFPYPGEARPIRMLAADPTTGEVVALDFQSVNQFAGTLGGGGVSTGGNLPSRSATISALEENIRTRPNDANVVRWKRRLEKLRAEQAAGVATAPPPRETEGERSPRVAPPSQSAPSERPAPPAAPAAAKPVETAAPAATQPAAPAAATEAPEMPERVRMGPFKTEEEATRVATILAKQKPGSEPKVVQHKGGWAIEANDRALRSPEQQRALDESRARLQAAIEAARGGGKPPEEGGAPATRTPEPTTPAPPSGAAPPSPAPEAGGRRAEIDRRMEALETEKDDLIGVDDRSRATGRQPRLSAKARARVDEIDAELVELSAEADRIDKAAPEPPAAGRGGESAAGAAPERGTEGAATTTVQRGEVKPGDEVRVVGIPSSSDTRPNGSVVRVKAVHDTADDQFLDFEYGGLNYTIPTWQAEHPEGAAAAPPREPKYAPGTRVFTPYVGKRRAKRGFDRGIVVNTSHAGEEPMVTVQVSRGGGVRKGLQKAASKPTYELHEIPERLLRRRPTKKTQAERNKIIYARGQRLAKGLSVAQIKARHEAVEAEAQQAYEEAYAQRRERLEPEQEAARQAAIDRALRIRREVLPALASAMYHARRRIDEAPARAYEAYAASRTGEPEVPGVDQASYEKGPGRFARHVELTKDAMLDAKGAKDPAAGKAVLDLLADDIAMAKDYEKNYTPADIAKRMRNAADPAAEWKKINSEIDELIPPSPADYSHGSGDFGGGMSAFGAGEVGRLIGRIFHRKVLRGIPRAQQLLRRQQGADAFRIKVKDSRGNTRDSDDAIRFEDDPFTNSAFHRLVARLGHGRSVLEPKQALDFIHARSDESLLLQEFFLRRATALGKEGMSFSAPYLPGARHLSRATERSSLPYTIPASLSHLPGARRAFLKSIFDDMNAARVAEGMQPVKPRANYTPHNTMGAFAEAYDDIFKQLAGRPMTPREIEELKNRHLEVREGDTRYIEDSALQDYLYAIRASRYIAYLPFLKRMATWLQDNAHSNPERAELVRDWMKSVFFPSKGRMETMLDGVARLLTMEQGPKPVRTTTNEVAARLLGVPQAGLAQYKGGIFTTEHGAKVRGTEPTAITFLGTKDNIDYYGATKGHVVSDEPFQLRSYAKGFLENRAKFKVRLKAALSRLPGAKRAGFLDTAFHTVNEHETAAISELNDAVQRFGNNPTAAWTSLIGRNQVKALIAGNISTLTQNSMNNLLTTYPEFGLSAVLRGVKAEAKGTSEMMRAGVVDFAESGGWITPAEATRLRKAIKLTGSSHLAEALGSLQGEVPRQRQAVLRRLAGADAVYRRFLDAMNAMNPYRGVEDLTRGVDAYAAAVTAARMGLSPLRVRAIYDATQASRIALNRELSKNITDTRTAESFVAQMYPRTMYDYGPLGQMNLHRTALSGWLARLTTFPTNYMLEHEYRPLAGLHAGLGAMVRGAARTISGGRIGRKLPGATRSFGRPFQRAGRYPPPRTPVERWLEEGGAGHYQRQAAKVLYRQLKVTGALAALSAATGLNFFVFGTPGYQYLAVQMLAALSGDERLKKTAKEMQRGAIVNYARGAVPAGPALHLALQVGERAKAVPARYRKLSKNDKEAAQRVLHVAQAAGETLLPGLAEFGRQMTGAPILFLRRAVEVEPEFFDRVDPQHLAYRLLGIKQVYAGLSKREKWMRQHNLLPQSRLDEAKRKAIPDKASGTMSRPLPGGLPRMKGLPKMSRGAA